MITATVMTFQGAWPLDGLSGGGGHGALAGGEVILVTLVDISSEVGFR